MGFHPFAGDVSTCVFSTICASSLAVLGAILIRHLDCGKASQLGKGRFQALPVMIAGDVRFDLCEHPGADLRVAASGGQKHSSKDDFATGICLADLGPKARKLGFGLRYFLFDGQRHRVFLSAMKGSIMPVNTGCGNPERAAKGALTTWLRQVRAAGDTTAPHRRQETREWQSTAPARR